MPSNFFTKDPSHYKRYATALQCASEDGERVSVADTFSMSAYIERSAYMMDNRSSYH